MEQTMGFIKNFPLSKRSFWKNIEERIEKTEEIRMRAEKPMIIYGQGEEWYIDKEGRRTGDILRAGKISYAEIQELVDYWCQDSRYAYQKELKNGYLTMKGGHRIGICGEAVISREEKIQTIKHISSLNIRIAHQCKMAGAQVLAHLYNGDRLYNTLIISPPGAGKTTMLRDLVRRISDGSRNALGKTVGLVDERGEIAACFQGIPQLDVGMRTDVLDGCPKAEGMMRLLRSMSPKVIAVDELGSMEEGKALLKMAGCGCSILATVHGNNLEEIEKKKLLRCLLEEQIFERIMVLERKEGRFLVCLYKRGEEIPCWTC
ncbi:MAG: stage III sporulation protein AA [Lachnospiraceae bacterium]|nr:stage III sporulation protein AA [Lachnospiraceae bacterium]MDD7026236.1 stage III sporulation protein AA [Lachnospiraceae bacterium]